MKFLSSFLIRAKKVPVALAISDCRDPKDNKFLELANDGNTGYIITGDKDLLTFTSFGYFHRNSCSIFIHPFSLKVKKARMVFIDIFAIK